MTVDDQTLRRLLQEATGRNAGRGRACPASETLVRAAAPPLRMPDLALIDHLVACRDCAQEFQVLRDVATWALRAAESGHQPARRGRPWWGERGWTAAAAAAALLVLAPFVRETEGPAGRYRAPTGAIIRAFSEDRPASREAAVLRWTVLEDGTTYLLTVAGEDLTVLHTADGLTAAEYSLPPTVLARVPRGGHAFWRVEARLPGGRRIVSEVFVLRLD